MKGHCAQQLSTFNHDQAKHIDSTQPICVLYNTLTAVVAPVVALVNNTLLQPAALAVDPQPAPHGGWDNLADELDFPADLLDDELRKDFKCKGENLVTAMYSSNFDAAKLHKPSRPTAESPWEHAGNYMSPC